MLDKKQLGGGLPLSSLNHISLVCRSLERSLDFYTSVLGFFPIRRPGSFDFDGAWLFNYGIGIHLLQSDFPDHMPHLKTEINPKDNHISFQKGTRFLYAGVEKTLHPKLVVLSELGLSKHEIIDLLSHNPTSLFFSDLQLRIGFDATGNFLKNTHLNKPPKKPMVQQFPPAREEWENPSETRNSFPMYHPMLI